MEERLNGLKSEVLDVLDFIRGNYCERNKRMKNNGGYIQGNCKLEGKEGIEWDFVIIFFMFLGY